MNFDFTFFDEVGLGVVGFFWDSKDGGHTQKKLCVTATIICVNLELEINIGAVKA